MLNLISQINEQMINILRGRTFSDTWASLVALRCRWSKEETRFMAKALFTWISVVRELTCAAPNSELHNVTVKYVQYQKNNWETKTLADQLNLRKLGCVRQSRITRIVRDKLHKRIKTMITPCNIERIYIEPGCIRAE